MIKIAYQIRLNGDNVDVELRFPDFPYYLRGNGKLYEFRVANKFFSIFSDTTVEYIDHDNTEATICIPGRVRQRSADASEGSCVIPLKRNTVFEFLDALKAATDKFNLESHPSTAGTDCSGFTIL